MLMIDLPIGWSLLTIGLCYGLGAIPFAVIVGRLYGVNVLTQGSCNPGATNVTRLAGPWAGRLVFVLDALKGAIAIWSARLILEDTGLDVHVISIIAFFLAIIGHSFSIFLLGRGGKGVATAIGGLCMLMPVVLAVGLLVWLVIFYGLRYVSLASIGFAFSLPISSYFLNTEPVYFYLTIVLSILIIGRHHQNIKNLLQKKENRLNKK